MFNLLKRLFKSKSGELLKVTAISIGSEWNGFYWPHTLVEMPDGRRLCVNGYRGKPGDVFSVYSNQLWEPS